MDKTESLNGLFVFFVKADQKIEAKNMKKKVDMTNDENYNVPYNWHSDSSNSLVVEYVIVLVPKMENYF